MRRFALLVLALAGCGAAPSPSAVALADATPTLSFAADWTVTQSGPLVAGAQALLHYDPARLPRCRATYNGGAAWNIQASWAADGGFAQNAGLMEFQNGGYVAVDVPFVVPFGHDLAVWFLNSDENGCTGWDSNYGNNFHFPIQSPPNPIIHFHADWSITVDGTLRAGQPFIIDYDLHRLPDCRQDYNGLPTWDVTAHARFDDGSTVDASLTQLEGQYNRVAAPATVNAPAGAHAVELWFENSDRTGCQRWDSSYGQNFKYDLN